MGPKMQGVPSLFAIMIFLIRFFHVKIEKINCVVILTFLMKISRISPLTALNKMAYKNLGFTGHKN